MQFGIFTNIIKFLSDPINFVYSSWCYCSCYCCCESENAPNSREKTDILKCEILNFLQNATYFQTWVKLATLGHATPAKMSELLDTERIKQIGIWGKVLEKP